MKLQLAVIPAEAGIQSSLWMLDTGFRRYDIPEGLCSPGVAYDRLASSHDCRIVCAAMASILLLR